MTMLDRLEQLDTNPILCAAFCILVWDEFLSRLSIDDT
jgi:hypothetical protein